MVVAKLFGEAQKMRKAGAKKPPVKKVRPMKRKRPPPQEKNASSGSSSFHHRRPQDPTAEQKHHNKRRRDHGGQNNHHRHSNGKRVPPSAEALEFSQKLKELSRQKRLDEAVKLYWDRVPKGVADQHHACIVVDCAARCGDVEAAERIVQHLRRRGEQEPLSVETQTALLKGYAHAGRIAEAADLFRGMKRFNVRTLNTLLRGCLWTAVTTRDDPVTGAAAANLVGGVVTSEEAWKLYQAAWPGAASTLDVSSYEYSISLLCQALRTKEAEERIGLFQTTFSIRVKGTASIAGGDQASLETLAVVYLGLSRAHALLGQSDEMWRSCQRALCAIKLSRARLLEDTNTTGAVVAASEADATQPKKKKKRGASGGKRAWKASRETEEGTATSSFRESSNVAFRTHRLSELENEVRSLLKTRGKQSREIRVEAMAKHLQTRLLYFSGSGSTDITAVQGQKTKLIQSESHRPSHLTSAWFSFGLSRFAKEEIYKTVMVPSHNIDSSWIADRCGFSKVASPVHEDGTIRFEKVFDNNKRPLDIEIGAGFGTWICQQAQENKDRNHVAVELRADRVSHIFARAMLDSHKPLDNVCVVGAECGSLFRDRIKKASVSCIFANYPEPPTQTHGDDRTDLLSIANGAGKEPAHMLNSTSIIEMCLSLKADGKIVVVSDNRFYARLLAATFARVVNQDKKLIRSVRPNELKDSALRHVESFSNVADLYEGQPERAIGHAKNTSSYFDRLWRTGAGSHSERRNRFVIVMQRS